MKLKVDKDTDAIYFRLDDSKILESEEVEKGVILDYNEFGDVVGFEILHISERSKHFNYNSLQFENS